MDETGIIIFLLAAVAVVAVIAAVLVVRLHYKPDEYEELSELFDDLMKDHTTLQAEKAAVEDAALGYLVELKTVKAENTVLANEIIKLRNVLKNHDTSSNSQNESVIPENILRETPTNKFTCEPYLVERAGHMVSAFVKNSDHARLQEDCATDPETGIRYYYDGSGTHYLCAALGHAFGTEIGTAYRFTLQNGYTFPVILADYMHPVNEDHEIYDILRVLSHVTPDKAYGNFFELRQMPDGHWEPGEFHRNYDDEEVLHVIEFVADLRVIPHAVRDAGTFTVLEQFGGLHGHGGCIAKVEKIGRVWEP